ncbi:ABC transporter ATP-binding protein [Lysinibacillus mangiferihumi]|uniref:ABC transporter ATP-binding protein n=1 Tax=Lysinibacillus mangiferihumi TaxID=1130819 RepID=A0A4U2YYL1_9BACI|nr:ABC transporter ATP-binding protein [Lysinibacillus mangiferihumi]TKI66295.1 ABC transporter ATP-binding protein [Lysinibacillus mangiferihumi]
MEKEKVLEVKDLTVKIGEKNVLSSINMTAYKGRVLGIIGESGSGKTMLCHAIMQSLPSLAQITQGQVLYRQEDLMAMSASKLRAYRGRHLSMIMQNPATAFDSIQTIEKHFLETLKAHFVMTKKEMRQIAIDTMYKVNLPNVEQLLHYYPFQLSGGMLQRVMIALSLAIQSTLYIADEPTTALDTVNQKQVLTLFDRICSETGAAIILVTHDLGVIAELADDVAVMYKGEIIEQANVFDFFDAPQHPYTKKLLQSRITF